ncbi:TonB-dependent receptor domain-containing protein, partial [Aliarcobacter butzleri]|uniref:TonB-dependent receptor domain-containing protein n=1 Tax=Aliarcobacter butzleri TaxID=28197 RepID=UPI003AF5409B
EYNAANGVGNREFDNEVTPYVGLIYDLDDNHSIYTSWTQIFQPQNSIDKSGNLLEPITGTNYEAGIKGEYFDGALNATIAAFLIKQEHRAHDDVQGPDPCP